MKCAEVMELMQRHLDGDLNNEEMETMMNHLKQCPDCAEMMQRLKRIDEDLANLPKVTPPYSIVDSILPRLAKIDESASGAVDGLDQNRSDAATLEQGTEPYPSRPRPWYARMKFARIGGLAAAAAVLGILIVQGLPNRMGDSLAENGSTSATNSAMPLVSTAGSSALPEDRNESQAAEKSSLKEIATDPSTTMSDTPEVRMPMSADAGGNGSGAPGDSGQGVSGHIVGNQGTHDVGIATVPPGIEGGQIFGFTAVPDEVVQGPAEPEVGATGFVSPDGKYAAFVTFLPDGMVTVSVKAADGTREYVSNHRWNQDEAKIAFEAWRDTSVSYTVTIGEEVRTFVIDASTETEVEITP